VNKSLLDTDILSEIGKGIDQTVARNSAAYRTAFGRYTLSTVSVMEVIRGLEKRQSVRRLQAFLVSLPSLEILPFAESAAELAARIVGKLERTGQPIGIADPMIAAIALTHGLELVTGNTAHFQRIQQLGYPLTLANWRQRSLLSIGVA
jgi:tRNA(fMet)-specific endonuclease VapC